MLISTFHSYVNSFLPQVRYETFQILCEQSWMFYTFKKWEYYIPLPSDERQG